MTPKVIKNTLPFEVEGKKYLVKKPDANQRHKAGIVEAKTFKEALLGGAILRERITDALVSQGLLTAEKQQEIRDIQQRLDKSARSVPDEKGKVREKGVTSASAKAAAILMYTDRMRLQILNTDRVTLESKTAEGLAENAKFEYLVSACTVEEETGDPVFVSVEDYQDRVNRDEPLALKAANLFAYLYRDIDPDFSKNLPENKYLASIGFFEPEPEAAPEEEFDLVVETTTPASQGDAAEIKPTVTEEPAPKTEEVILEA